MSRAGKKKGEERARDARRECDPFPDHSIRAEQIGLNTARAAGRHSGILIPVSAEICWRYSFLSGAPGMVPRIFLPSDDTTTVQG